MKKEGIIQNMSESLPDVKALNTEQQLRLLEQLWDSLSEQPESLPLTAAQRAELDRRLDDLECYGADGILPDDVLSQIWELHR